MTLAALADFFTVKRLLTLVGLTATWCILWREISVGNLLAGAAVALVVSATGVGLGCRGGLALVPLLRLIGAIGVDLVTSTISVARSILSRTERIEESIVAVELPPESRDHLLLLIVAITLTPGTAVVDADPRTPTVYLHLLDHSRRDATVAHVHELSRLACAALPTPDLGATA